MGVVGRAMLLTWALAAGSIFPCLVPRALSQPTSRDPREVLGWADRAIMEGTTASYQGATDELERLITEENDLSILREAYLLLVRVYVSRSTAFFFNEKDLDTSDLYRDHARATIRACLLTPGLSDTRPDTAVVAYPEPMVQLFEEERLRVLGGFRVTSLVPPDAVVNLNGQVLGNLEEPGLPGNEDLPAGLYTVSVSAPGYRSEHAEIEIRPGLTLSRDFELKKGRDWKWWALRITVVGGVAIGIATIIDFSGGPEEPDPLPGPPDPP